MRALLFALVAALAATSAEAQQVYSPPKTSDGRPDFQGVWMVSFITMIERPDGIPGPIVPRADEPKLAEQMLSEVPKVIDPDFAFYSLRNLVEVKGTLRTSLLMEPTDGKVPFSPTGLKAAEEADRLFMNGFDNPEERDNYERCLAGMLQAPIRPFPVPVPFLFVQTPDQLVISGEDVQATRIVHMTGSPPPQAVRSREGWSSGRWDGDTLVITTTHLRGDDPFRPTMGRPLVVGADSRVVERLTRVSETELHYEFTIEDPSIYARPWMAEFSFRLDRGETVYEYACHEANYSMVNMLNGGREADKRKQNAR